MIEIKENESLLMDADEVQKILGVGKNKTYDTIRDEKIPHFTLGRRIKIYRKGFYEWLENKIGATC